MGASLALAGVTACTRQPAEKIVPYVRQPEELVPGQPLFFATAMTARRRRHRAARREPRGPADEDRGQPAASGQPRRDRRLRAGRDPRPLRSRPLADADRTSARSARGRAFLGAIRAALDGAAAAQRAPASGSSPRRSARRRSPRRFATCSRGIPSAKWHQWEPASRDNARAGARLAFGEYVDAQYRFDQADVIVALDADFLGCGPAALRYARDFAARRRPEQADRMNRLYAVETMPTLDRRARRPSAAAEPERRSSAVARGIAAARRRAGVGLGTPVGARPSRARRGSTRSRRTCRRTAAAASSSPATASRRRSTRSRTR